MGGLYDILESYRLQDPKFTYDGLYQDPMKSTNVLDPNYSYRAFNPESITYGYSPDFDNLQARFSSSFPQEFGVGSLFNPRVGRPEQSIYYNEPEPADPTSDFYQPIGDPFQTDYPITRTIQEDEDQMIQEITAPYTGVTGIGYQTPRTITDQNRILGQTFTEQKPSGIARLFEVLGNIPTPFNLARRGLESLQGFNRKIRGTTFALSPTLKDYVQAKRAEKRAEAGADVGVGPGGSGSRRGDADIASRDRGSFRTDDTAGFF